MSRRTGRYAKLFDGILHHQKFIGLDPAAGWLWTLGLAYCHDQLTDGHIPPAVPARLLGMAPHRAGRVAGLLVRAGLWDAAGEGWTVHDYLDWNDSRAEILADQAAVATRQRHARQRRDVTPPVTPSVTRSVTPMSRVTTDRILSEPNRTKTTALEQPTPPEVSHDTNPNGTEPSTPLAGPVANVLQRASARVAALKAAERKPAPADPPAPVAREPETPW